MFAADSYRPLVTLLLRVIPHHRVSLLTRLAARLNAVGIDLQVLFSEGPQGHSQSLGVNAPWARRVTNAARLGSIDVIWQPAMREIVGSDLVVIEHPSQPLAKGWLHFQRRQAGFQLALWGDGRMPAGRTHRLMEYVKRTLAGEVDWWFAHTELSKQRVMRTGFPADNITVVNDTVDSDALAAAMRRLREQAQAQLARELGCESANVAVFCGTSHRDEHIDFLLRAAERIRDIIPDFELLIVGPAHAPARIEAYQRPWIKRFGAETREQRAPYLRAARLMLIPCIVGLVVADSFVSECPLLTTTHPVYSAEIAYLHSGQNCLIVDEDVAVYANAAAWLLRDEVMLARLRRGCQESARRYSHHAMVERFAGGIESCVRRPLMTEVMLS